MIKHEAEEGPEMLRILLTHSAIPILAEYQTESMLLAGFRGTNPAAVEYVLSQGCNVKHMMENHKLESIRLEND